MGSVFVYPPTLDEYGYSQTVTRSGGFGEYATLGMCGELLPTKCEFSQKAGEFGQLTMTHPRDAYGKWKCLKRGYVLKAAVPVREMPAMDDNDAYIGTVYKYTIRNDATKAQRAVYKKRLSADRKEIICYAPRNASVTVVKRYFTSDHCKITVTVKGKKYTGFIVNDALSEQYTEVTIPTTSSGIESADPSYAVKYQLFRIDAVDASDADGGTVTVTARRIVYDLSYMPSTYRKNGTVTASEAAHGVLDNVLGLAEPSEYAVFCDIADERVGFDARARSIIEGWCDPQEGITGRYGAQALCDDYEVYLLRNAGLDRGVTVRYDKDIAGVKCTVDAGNVVTGILPIGETATGNTLYIDADASAYIPSGYVQETRPGSGTIREILYRNDTLDVRPRRIGIIRVSDAKEDTKTEGGSTALNARRRLINAAVREFENGCDRPKISMTVDLATAESGEFRRLSALFIFDTVRVYHAPMDIDERAVVSSVTWDVIRDRMTRIEIGAAVESQATVKGYQISGGLNGVKILDNTIGGASLSDESVSARNLTAATVTADKLAANSVEADKLAAGSVTADKIGANEVKATNIDVENLTANGTFRANVGEITDAKIGSADIGFAQIKDAVAENLITKDAVSDRYFIDKLQVRNLQVVEQTVGSLILKAADGYYYRLNVDASSGTLTTTRVNPTAAEIANGVTEDGSRSIIETAITAESLAATTIKGINALIDSITSNRIDVNQLFAREAVVNLVKANAITALDESRLNFYVTREDMKRDYMRLVAGEGLYVGEEGSVVQARVSSNGFEVLNSGEPTTALGDRVQRIGRLKIFETADGGCAFKPVEM